MIEFSIPDFWQMSLLNSFLINAMIDHPEFFNDDTKVTSIFGSFPCIWNGGRGLIQGMYSRNVIIRVMEFFNERHISLRHTFTNRFLKDIEKYDHIGNQICELTSKIGQKYNVINGCVVYSEDLSNHIKEHFPDLQIIYSTTKELKTIENINKYSQNNLVVPSYTINHNMDLLKQLKYPQNIELLSVEQGCIPNCPNREIHQDCVSQLVLNEFDITTSPFNDSKCPLLQEPYVNWYQWCNNPQIYISIDQIRQEYLPLGFNKFKIAGRGFSVGTLLNNVESFLNYLVKPEYQNFIRIELLNLVLGEQLVMPIGALNM